jgi:hypothetical protein
MSETLSKEEAIRFDIENTDLTIDAIITKHQTCHQYFTKVARKYFSEEFLRERKRKNYARSKTGKSNPMYGLKGEKSPNYKGLCSDNKGYWTVVRPDWYDSNAKRVFYHHVVYAKHHGLDRVPPGMCIHHVDGNPSNNEPDNLWLLTPSEHTLLHSKGIIPPRYLWTCNDYPAKE